MSRHCSGAKSLPLADALNLCNGGAFAGNGVNPWGGLFDAKLRAAHRKGSMRDAG